MLSSPLPCHLVPLIPNCLPHNLFSNNFSLCCSLNVRDQASHPYKTKGKNYIYVFFIFVFLGNKLEDKVLCTKWCR